MRILVVHEVSYLRKVIYEIHEFPELLSLRGHEITFLDFDEGASRKSIGEPRDRLISGRIHPGARIRLVTPHRFGIQSIDRLWAIFSSVPLMIKLLSKGNYDVVLNFAVPTYAIQLNLIAKIFGVPVLHRALDISNKIRKSVWNWLIYIYEALALRLPNSLSANNPAMSTYLKSRLPKKYHQRIQIHYPPLDTEIFHPTASDLLLAKSLGIEANDIVLMYMGSFFYFSGLDLVIEDLAPRMREDKRIKLLLIGGGEQEAVLRNKVAELDLGSQVIFTGFIAFEDLARYMSLATVAINPLKNSLVAGAAFPHKVLQYMATGIPTVSTKLEGLFAAFGETSGITWVTGAKELVQAALELSQQSAESREIQVQSQLDAIKRLFSKEATVTALESSLLEIARRGSK